MTVIIDTNLRRWASRGGITPYDPANINPASIDLRWSGRYRLAMSPTTDEILRIKSGELDPQTLIRWTDIMQAETLTLYRGCFYLFDTLEYIIVPSAWAGALMLKSSLGRLGMEHLHAGWFDPGFEGTGTLEVENRHPVPLRIERGQRIMQMVFYHCEGQPERDYTKTGRYVGQITPTEAREHGQVPTSKGRLPVRPRSKERIKDWRQ